MVVGRVCGLGAESTRLNAMPQIYASRGLGKVVPTLSLHFSSGLPCSMSSCSPASQRPRGWRRWVAGALVLAAMCCVEGLQPRLPALHHVTAG